MGTDFDVIIVGAGPGGSNAATVALRRGLSVAQIERYPFPRVKPCAGGVTIKACKALQLDLEPSLRRSFDGIEFNVWHQRTNRFSRRTPIIKMILRPDFDNRLVEQNRRSDAFSFFDGEPVMGIEHDGNVFRVRTNKRTFSCKQLIGADGAYGIVNRIFGIAQPKASAVAIEVNIYKESASLENPLLPCFDFGAVERGYGWVFPKDDHWSVGLYTFARGIKDLRARLTHYVADKGFTLQPGTTLEFEAYLVPVGGFRFKVPKVPVYVVGDAGGFADALTGEGIYHALESGRLAGETAADMLAGKCSQRRYYRRLWGTVLADTLLTYYISRKFYRNVDKAISILENPLVWRPFVEGYAEGATFTGSILKGGFYLFRSLLGNTLQHEKTRHETRSLRARPNY